MRSYVLPRFLRSPFVVALWSCYESGVESISRELHQYVGGPDLHLRDLRGDLFDRARRYFEAVLGLELEDSADRLGRLRDLYLVRNAIVHANGLKDAMAVKEWARLGAVVARNGMELSSHRGLLVPTEGYVQEAHSDVGASLRELVRRARLRADSKGSEPAPRSQSSPLAD
jgi:hypothetical protein